VLAGVGGGGPVAQRVFRGADVVERFIRRSQLKGVLADRMQSSKRRAWYCARPSVIQPSGVSGTAGLGMLAGSVAVRSFTNARASASAGLNSTALSANSRASSVLPTDFSQRAKNV
jgi:hypothetical protein